MRPQIFSLQDVLDKRENHREERRRGELLARKRRVGGGDHVTEQRRVNSACHFSFVFTCRRSAEDSSSDGERCLDLDRRRDAEQIDSLEGVR